MSTNLPAPITFDLPKGWQVAPPDKLGAPDASFVAVHLPPDDGFTANITIDGEYRPDTATLPEIADESVEHMDQAASPVVVTDRCEAGSSDAPGFTQTLAFSISVAGKSRALVQSQAYLSLLDIEDPHKRVVIRFVLTSTESQHPTVLDDFRALLGTVRPGDGGAP